jgi:hypothetical protein
MNALVEQPVDVLMAQAAALTHREKIAFLVRELAKVEQVECPLKHYFAPGVYLREIFMPAGSIIIGKIHKTEHFNLIERGRCTLYHEDGRQELLEAPHTFVSKAGVQKVLHIHEDMVWRTIHVTEETDLERLEAQLIEGTDYPLFDRTIERLAIEEASRWHG